MGEAKQILVQPISSADANRIVKSIHYSGRVVNNSQVHLGVFLDGKCGGAMQFGPSLDKRKLQGLVRGTKWNEFIELNRMAFADWLPRNGESRAIGFAMRWLRKTYPFLKWVVSFADATQCGDGTIYRASGFVLTGITKNKSIYANAEGKTVSDIGWKTGKGVQKKIMNAFSWESDSTMRSRHGVDKGGAGTKSLRAAGFVPLPGFQIRYVYFLDPSSKDQLTVPILPFSEIARRGASMYKGERNCAGSADSGTAGNQPEGSGANPTPALQPLSNG